MVRVTVCNTTIVMSFQAAIARLNQPLNDLVQSTLRDVVHASGKSDKDQAEVVQWIDMVAQGDIVKPGSLTVILKLLLQSAGSS